MEEIHMKRKKHSPEQVISKLAEGDRMLNEGKTVAEVARAFGISETTWHRWKNTYGGMKGPDMKRAPRNWKQRTAS